jgi:WD40 repeat protein
VAIEGGKVYRVTDWMDGPAFPSPDGKRVLVQRPAGVLDLETGKVVCKLEGDLRRPLRPVSPFSPDGRRVVGATVTPSNAALIWDAATGKVLARLVGHRDSVTQARFSRDGRLVLTVSDDHTARVWDAETGRELHTLTGHGGPVLQGAFSPDGKRVATVSADGTARVWELDLLAVAAARRPRELTPEEKQRYEVGEDK